MLLNLQGLAIDQSQMTSIQLVINKQLKVQEVGILALAGFFLKRSGEGRLLKILEKRPITCSCQLHRLTKVLGKQEIQVIQL